MKRESIAAVLTRAGVLAVFAAALSMPVHSQPGFTSIATVRLDVKYQRGVGEAAARKVAEYLQSDYGSRQPAGGADL
jgi:hypothetical protein